MKYFISLFASVTLSFSAVAQVQVGLAREFDSKKKPIGGVQVNFTDAVPTTSGDDGYFRLAFKDKEPGDFIFLNEIKKTGYELVNKPELEKIQFTRNTVLAEDVILARIGVIDAAKMKYHQISAAALTAKYEREKKALADKLKKAILSQQDWEEQSKQLQKEVEKQQKNLEAYADKFARMNPDDMGRLQQEALELFKAGDINRAIKKLEQAGFIGRLKDNLEEKKKIIKGTLFQAELYALNLQMKEAGSLYDHLLQLDSTDLEALQNVSDFYREQHLYQKALQFYPNIIKHPEAKVWQKANAYIAIGDIYILTGRLPNALISYSFSLVYYDSLYKKNSSFSFYAQNLGIVFSRFGETYIALSNPQKALEYFEQFHQLEKQLYECNPDNMRFKNNLAHSFSKLGETYMELGNLPEALRYFEQYYQLEKQLYNAYSDNVGFKNSLAYSFSKLGRIHFKLGNLPKALGYYSQYNQLEKQLHETYPDNVGFKNSLAVSFSKLGEINTVLSDFRIALEYFEKCSQLEKQLYEAYPDNVDFKNNLSASFLNLGETNTALGNFQIALGHFEQCSQLAKELHEAHPDNLAFKNGLAISYTQIGQVYVTMEQWPQALPFFVLNNQLCKELHQQFPEQKDYRQDFAFSSRLLGLVYFVLTQKDSALYHLDNALLLFRQLLKDKSEDFSFFSTLRTCFDDAITVSSAAQKYPQTMQYSLLCIALLQIGQSNFPDSANWNREIASCYANIAFYALLLQQFPESEQYALTGLATDSTKTLMYEILASAYLYQGKWEQAKAIYIRLKDQPNGEEPFKVAFLQDLKDLETAGITHPDVVKARALLEAK